MRNMYMVRIAMCITPECKPTFHSAHHPTSNDAKITCAQHYSKLANHRRALHKICGRNSDKNSHDGDEKPTIMIHSTTFLKKKYPILFFCAHNINE